MKVDYSTRGAQRHLTIEASSNEWRTALENGSLAELAKVVSLDSPFAHITITDEIRTYLRKPATVTKLKDYGITSFSDLSSQTADNLTNHVGLTQQEMLELRREIMTPFKLRFSNEQPFDDNPNREADPKIFNRTLGSFRIGKMLTLQLRERGYRTVADLVSVTEDDFIAATRGAMQDETSNSPINLIRDKILDRHKLEFYGGKRL